MTENGKRTGKVLHPRIPDDLHDEIAAYAAANNRTIPNALIHLATIGLAAEQTRQDA